MALEIWWGSGSPYSWRALLALEYKQLPYVSHLVQFAKQEHKAPALVKMNPRGRVPVVKDGDYVCFESLAILHYLDRKYPQPPLFGRTAEEAGTIVRVICEYQSYAEEHIMRIIQAILFQGVEGRMEEIERVMGYVLKEAATIEHLAAGLERASFPPGALVFREGDEGDRYFVVVRGTAEVLAEGTCIARLGSGEGFGEIALLRDRPRANTIRAGDGADLEVCALSRDRFIWAVTGYASSRAAAEEIIAQRLGEPVS